MNSDSAARMAADAALQKAANELFVRSCEYRYSYNFSWMGRPIIQYPQDMVAMQEIIWSVRPDLVIETGIAHGGSLVYYASLLELLGNDGIVVGIDIDIRPHNREAHPDDRRLQHRSRHRGTGGRARAPPQARARHSRLESHPRPRVAGTAAVLTVCQRWQLPHGVRHCRGGHAQGAVPRSAVGP